MLGFRQWKDPLQERQLSVPFEPAIYNYHDYKMAWLGAFFLISNVVLSLVDYVWLFSFSPT